MYVCMYAFMSLSKELWKKEMKQSKNPVSLEMLLHRMVLT